MPKTQTQIKVLDVTEFSLSGFPYEKFDTLQEAFAWIVGELLDGCSERFEVKIPGASQPIQIDARGVDFDEIA